LTTERIPRYFQFSILNFQLFKHCLDLFYELILSRSAYYFINHLTVFEEKNGRAPIIDELATEYEGRVTIGKMNVDENDDVVGQFGISNDCYDAKSTNSFSVVQL